MHLNNCTLYRQSKIYAFLHDRQKFIFKNPKIVYKIIDDIFVFDHYGLFSVLIDFSRGIISNRSLLEHKFGKSFTDKFYTEQKVRVLRIINKHFPDIVKNNYEELVSVILDNFPLIFKILSAIDPYTICKAIRIMFETEFSKVLSEEYKIIIPKESIQLLQSIEIYSKEFLILLNYHVILY
jgi:hypothetical protein